MRNINAKSFFGLALTYFVLLPVCGSAFAEKPPVTGKAVAEFEPLDQVMLDFMSTIKCQAITAGVSKDGKLLYSRGFGWQDARKSLPTKPDALLRIASVTKSLTAAATKKLIREDKLTLDTRAFEFLKLTPPPGAKPDPRLGQITVAHLLEHKGGWDWTKSFDPMFRAKQVEQALKLRSPATATDMVLYMLGQPLQFDPGERSEYSNFGYCVLGRVIEKASGKSYAAYVQQEVCKPIGITDIKPAQSLLKDRDAREVSYPADGLVVEVMDAHGGFIASAPALCTFLDHYWINGEPRLEGGRGSWTFFGSLPGTTALVRQRMDGYNIAILCNGRRTDTYTDDNLQLKKLVDEAMDRVAKAGSK